MTFEEFKELPKGTRLRLKKGFTDACEDTFEAGMYVKTYTLNGIQRVVDGKPVGDVDIVLADDMCRFKAV